MKEIREWLESGQDYAKGMALYESHGSSRVVLTTLQYGATEFNRQKLRQELSKLAQQVTSPAPVYVVDTSGKRADKTVECVQVTQRVVASPEVHEQRRAWFAERNHLHPQLELVATTAERLVMSLRILELGDLISQSYAGQDLATTRPEPGHHLANVTDTGEIRRLLANLRPQRSKLKKRPERATDLAQVESDIKLLEERLNRDGGEPKLH